MPEREPRLSECTRCDTGVVECAHFGDLTLWLYDNRPRPGQSAGPGHRVSNEWIVAGPLRPEACLKASCPGHLVMPVGPSRSENFAELRYAQAEFLRRAELLRLREPSA